MSYQRWTDDEVKTLKTLYQRYSLSEVARRMGRSRSSVSGKISDIRRSRRIGVVYRPWTPEDIQYTLSSATMLPIVQIAKDLRRPYDQISKLLHTHGVKAQKIVNGNLDNCKVIAAMLGTTHATVSRYVIRGQVKTHPVGIAAKGCGARFDIDMGDIYELAKTPFALVWRITDAMPQDLAAIVRTTHHQWMHSDELFAAHPLYFPMCRPWNRPGRPAPVMHKGTQLYYERASLYDVIYTHYGHLIPRVGIAAPWLRAIIESWDGTYIVAADAFAKGITHHDLAKLPKVYRGVYRRRDLVAWCRQRGMSDLAREFIGSDVHYVELMRPEDRP